MLEDLKASDNLQSLALLDDPLRLTLLALTDFHYETLQVRLGNTAEGKANLKVVLLGKNPELLGGTPFDLNVNLDTNLLPLLEAVQNGLVLGRELLPGKWRFGR